MLKSQEFASYHDPLSQEWINGRYRTFKQYVTIKPATLEVVYLVTVLNWIQSQHPIFAGWIKRIRGKPY